MYIDNHINEEGFIEREWLEEIIGKKIKLVKIKELDVNKNKTLIIVVQKPTPEYILTLQNLEHNFIAIHLSDEHILDNISWYSFTNCKQVIRNYVRNNIPVEIKDKVITIPLGYVIKCEKRTDEIKPEYLWGFYGTNWFNRKEKLAMISTEHSIVKMTDKWEGIHDIDEYKKLLKSVIFMPCPRGNNYETFRLYECLEMGIIPLYIREKGDDIFWKWLTECIPLMNIPTWDSVNMILYMMISEPERYKKYYLDLTTAWEHYKIKLKKDIRILF